MPRASRGAGPAAARRFLVERGGDARPALRRAIQAVLASGPASAPRVARRLGLDGSALHQVLRLWRTTLPAETATAVRAMAIAHRRHAEGRLDGVSFLLL